MVAPDQSELALALFTESGDAMFLLDPDTDRLVEANPVAERITGFPRAELLRFTTDYLFRFEAAGGAHRLKAAFSKTTVFHAQDGYLLRNKDGAWVPVSLTVSRLHLSPKTLGLIVARDDRERRGALAQARRVEAELRAVLTNSPAALWSAERAPGPDVFAGWQFRYVSPLLARIAGRPADALGGPLAWVEVVHPLDREAYRAAVHKLLTGGGEFDLVYRVQSPAGAVRWVRDRLQVVFDASNRPARLDGCLSDVTEQWRAEAAVQQSEERFRALVEKSRDGILLLDERGVVRYAAPAVRTILGYAPADLVGRPALDFVHPDDAAAARDRLGACLARPGEDVPGVFRAVAAGGAVRVLEMNGVNRLDDPSVRAVVINYRDVTDREDAARERAGQHALLNGLFASVPDVVVYKDHAGLFLGGNPAFEELAGCPVAALVGKHCRDIFTADWAVRLRDLEDQVFASGVTTRTKDWVDYADGRKVLMDIAVAPLRAADGTTTGLIIVGRDVTAQERLEDELRQSHKLEAVGRLAGGIAHDFNNLLTVVLGNLELVRSGAATGADADEMLAATQRAAEQAADLTKQMLGFARRQPLRTTTVDLNALVRESIGLLRRTIDPRITVRFHPAHDLAPAAADPVQVQQVLMNLCLNARDAMPDGGALTLETANHVVAEEGEKPMVRLSVTDTGTGMSDEVRAKVFEPFFTTKGVGQGTGLGLAVVYGVAKAHGGWVDVASAPGAGSRFDVFLPRGQTTEDRVVQGAAPAVPTGRGETVLVADDEPLVRDLAKTALEMAGYHVLVASDGAEAVAVFRASDRRVAAAVLDSGMPRLSGRQVFEEIRRLDPTVRVLFASGYHHNAATTAEPGTAALNKPYTPSQLAAAVYQLLTAR